MPQERLSMRKIRDVLRYRHSAGLSLEAIARALKISKGVVAKYLRLASAAGVTWPIPEALDDAGLEKLLYRQGAAREADLCRTRLCAGSSGTEEERRHPDAALGRVPASRRRARLPIHRLLHPLPRLGRQAQALDAPDPPGRRETVRRLCRPDRADCRCPHRRNPAGQHLRRRARRFELHLRLRDRRGRPRPTG